VNPESRRILLATALSAVIMFAFLWLQNRYAPPQRPGVPDAGAAAPAAKSEPTAAPPLTAPAEPVKPVPAAPEETVVLETPEFRATFTSLGGALKSVELKGRKFRRQVKGRGEVPVDLVHGVEKVPWPGSLVA
jgi:YidC/Oxa1 family membrane protein insertase